MSNRSVPPAASAQALAPGIVSRARTSMVSSAYRLVLAGLVLVAALPAMLVAVVGGMAEYQRAQAAALAVAWLADMQADSPAPLWGRTQALALTDLVLLPGPQAGGEAREIVDADGRVLASGGDAQAHAWPSVVATESLQRRGHSEAQSDAQSDAQNGTQNGAQSGTRSGAPSGAVLRVTRSLRPTLALAAGVALACSALALLLWLGAFMRPMGVLRHAEGRMREHARHDALTGLHNRDGLRRHLQRALARCDGSFRTVAVLSVDLDRFRIVNDSLGHPAGDALLRGVADRIRAVTRSVDVVARLGADQFVIVVEGVSGAPAAAGMARNLLRALAPAYLLNGRETVATLSIGVAVASDHAHTVDMLLKGADAAMRAAKDDGGGRFRIYEAAMDADDRQRLDMELRLRQALQQQKFFLLYQPIMDAGGERIVAVEALMRWADPQRGTVSPNEFIPILEQTGLIVPAGLWALNEACRQAALWRAQGAHDMLLSVNVSPRQFAESDFVATVHKALAATGFPAAQLQLEVTEGLLLDPTPASLAKIDALARSGVRLAIDDFGMGYSSLAYLKRFKLHTLKIDRMFVRDIATAAQDAAIVRAIIDLGHGLGMRVTAEGVETEAQFHELRRLGCNALQGFLFSRPLPADALGSRLALPVSGPAFTAEPGLAGAG